jgi:putative transposase
MVAFPKGKLSERRKTTMQNEARDERVKAFETELKKLVRNLLESPYAGGAGDVLGDTPYKANGYYTRDLLTLVGPVEDLKVPRVREGDFHPRILSYRKRASLELSEIILALYAVGVSTRKISHFLEGIYGAFLFTSKHLSAHPSYRRGRESLAGKAPKRGVLRGIFGWELPLHSSRKNGEGTRVHGSRNQARWTEGDPRVLALWCRRGKRPELGRGS